MWAYSGIYRLVLFSDVFFSFWPKYIKNKCKGMHSAAKSLKSVANGGRDSICAASSPRLLAPYLLLINATQLIVSFCTITATGHEACCLENQQSTFCARDLLVRQLLLGTIQLLTFPVILEGHGHQIQLLQTFMVSTQARWAVVILIQHLRPSLALFEGRDTIARSSTLFRSFPTTKRTLTFARTISVRKSSNSNILHETLLPVSWKVGERKRMARWMYWKRHQKVVQEHPW